MYDRYIEVKNGLVFVDRINYLIMDCTMFPKDITYYVEIGEDWWVERDPFTGREKNEDIRHIALKILEEAEEINFARSEEENEAIMNSGI